MKTHEPRPGIRIAMTCAKDDCPHRAFGDRKWTCPVHGKAVRQTNRPYFGKSTI